MIKNYYRSYLRTKFLYASRMVRHRLRGQPRDCPYCSSASHVERICRKKWIVDILRCRKCGLIFRWPGDTTEELKVHYENEFAEAAPQVRLPDPRELPALLKADFAPLFGDLGHKISTLRQIKPSGRVLDYGCSWGYATAVLQKSGYDAIGFEISKSRCAFARQQLGLNVYDSIEELSSLPSGSFDVIYSNHVLEHLAAIKDTLAVCSRLLKADGIAFHILPNFTGSLARSGKWLNWIGEDHPIAPTEEFFKLALPAAGFQYFRFRSSPFDTAAASEVLSSAKITAPLDGDELLVMASKSPISHPG